MLGGAALTVALAACTGGVTEPPPPPPPTPVPVPPPRVVAEGSGSLDAEFIARVRPFITTLPGRIDATVDWTFASNDVDAVLVSGDCSFERFTADQCPTLASALSVSSKPERLSVASAPPGTYTLFIGNVGPGDESISFQVVLTPSAGAAAAAAPAAGAAVPHKLRRLGGRVEIP